MTYTIRLGSGADRDVVFNRLGGKPIIGGALTMLSKERQLFEAMMRHGFVKAVRATGTEYIITKETK